METITLGKCLICGRSAFFSVTLPLETKNDVAINTEMVTVALCPDHWHITGKKLENITRGKKCPGDEVEVSGQEIKRIYAPGRIKK